MAQYNLGAAYDARASESFHGSTVASKGHAQAQFHLGCAYASGLGVPRGPSEALRWPRSEHAQGYGRTPFNRHCRTDDASRQQQRPPHRHSRGAALQAQARSERGVVTAFTASSGRCSVELEDGPIYHQAREPGSVLSSHPFAKSVQYRTLHSEVQL